MTKQILTKDQILEQLVPFTIFNPWQRCLWETIQAIYAEHQITPFPYGRGNDLARYGCTRDVFWQGNRRMEAANPPLTYCSGIVLQTFWEAWNRYHQGQEEGLTLQDAEELYRFAFCRTDIDAQYVFGMGDAISRMDTVHFLGMRILRATEAIFGDFVQIHNPKPPYLEDHSVIALGVGRCENRFVLLDWSSTSHYEDGQPSGPGFDYHFIDLAGRSFTIGRLVERN